jgi:DNA-binding response OmpR family regulator
VCGAASGSTALGLLVTGSLSPEAILTPLQPSNTTILVVDDERMSRRVAYRILTEEGYRVLEADSGAEAFDVMRLARGRLDLLMIDVVMPECDGVAVGRDVLEQWPDQRILYMSAHPAQVLAEHGLTELNVPFLAKPYTRGEVLARVAEALERRHKKPRVLVVDDDSSIRASLAKMLTIAGYEVALAADGVEAARLWRERPADLVVLDLFMPEKDGLETIVELRRQSPDVPIIAMSGGGARTKMDLLPDAKLLGATMTIEKPYLPAEVMQLVDAALMGRRKRGA